MRARRVLILGGGVAGLATAWHLAQYPGVEVILLERERGFGRESSGKNAAILRAHGADPVTTELMRRAARFLRNPPAGFAPVPLLEACGLLLLASREAAADLSCSVAWEDAVELTRAQAEGLAPHVATEADLRLHFPGEGRIDVSALIDGFARGARAAGAELRIGTTARRLMSVGGRVSGVELADGSTLTADVTVLAAGAWAGRLGAGAGSNVELRPTRRHLLVTAPDPGVNPRWPVVWVEDAAFYCRPESGGMLLCACDLEDVDPDRCVLDGEVRARIAEKAARHLVGFEDARAAHFWCGMRTLTADDRFVLGPDPDLEGLFWVAGLGGHGMGAGPEVGRLAAALLTQAHLLAADRELAEKLSPGRRACAPAPEPVQVDGR